MTKNQKILIGVGAAAALGIIFVPKMLPANTTTPGGGGGYTPGGGGGYTPGGGGGSTPGGGSNTEGGGFLDFFNNTLDTFINIFGGNSNQNNTEPGGGGGTNPGGGGGTNPGGTQAQQNKKYKNPDVMYRIKETCFQTHPELIRFAVSGMALWPKRELVPKSIPDECIEEFETV